MADSTWTTIIPGDPSTLPTEADGRVLWRGQDGGMNVMEWNFHSGHSCVAIMEAWMPIPHYSPPEPPEPVKQERRSGIVGCTNLAAEYGVPDGYHTDLRIRRGQTISVIEVLPGDIDPDAAIRLREAVVRYLGTLDRPCSRFDERAAMNELREAAK